MSNKKTLSVQLERSEYSRLEALAKAENRSVSSYLRNVLTVSNILPGCTHTQPATKKSRALKKAA
jgi:hypothetical protein